VNTVIAYLELVADQNINLAPPAGLIISRLDQRLRFAFDSPDMLLTIEVVRGIMDCINDRAPDGTGNVIWAFSSVAIPVADLCTILDRWNTTGEPPLLSIVALEIESNQLATRGLAAFIGYEIAARFGDQAKSRSAAQIVSRLARHALMHGGLAADAAYEAVDGQRLRLDWSARSAAQAVVTIVL
jgi:hypothetical protein